MRVSNLIDLELFSILIDSGSLYLEQGYVVSMQRTGQAVECLGISFAHWRAVVPNDQCYQKT